MKIYPLKFYLNFGGLNVLLEIRGNWMPQIVECLIRISEKMKVLSRLGSTLKYVPFRAPSGHLIEVLPSLESLTRFAKKHTQNTDYLGIVRQAFLDSEREIDRALRVELARVRRYGSTILQSATTDAEKLLGVNPEPEQLLLF